MSPTETSSVSGLLSWMQPLLASLPRIGTALLIFPLLPPAVVSRQLKAAMTIVFVLAVWPLFAFKTEQLSWQFPLVLGYFIKEALIGALLGYMMGVLLWAFTTVGELIDVQAGFNNAQIFDPFAGHPAGPVSVLMSQLGVLLFISLGGFYVFLQLLYESLQLWPPEQFFPNLNLSFRELAIERSGSVLQWAARWATPLIAVLLLVELGIGLLNRASKELNAFYFALPVKALAVSLVLALLVAHLVDVVQQEVAAATSVVNQLDRAWRAP